MIFSNNNWLFRPLFDYEYKSYQIMAFEQLLHKKFSNLQLYPHLNVLNQSLKNIEYFEKAEQDLKDRFPLMLKGVDIDKKELSYSALYEDDKIEEFHSILELAKQKLGQCRDGAFELKNELKNRIHISPIGLFDRTVPGGYLFFRKPELTRIYSYEYRFVKTKTERYKEIRTVYLQNEKTSSFTNFSDIKLKYVKSQTDRYGINAYLIETDINIPHFESLMPLVKDYLIQLEPL